MDTSDTKSAAKLIVELFAVITFYLYFGGWVYASEMLSAFGITFGAAEIPLYFFIVYAYSVFFTTFIGWLLLVGIGACWYFLARVRLVRWAELTLALFIATVPFPMIRTLATWRAQRDAAYLRAGHSKSVTFTPSPTSTYPEEFLVLVRSGKLRLILQTKDRYYVFLQPTGEGGLLPAGTMYDLPTADFTAAVTLRDMEE